jgi:hypothetical protein
MNLNIQSVRLLDPAARDTIEHAHEMSLEKRYLKDFIRRWCQKVIRADANMGLLNFTYTEFAKELDHKATIKLDGDTLLNNYIDVFTSLYLSFNAFYKILNDRLEKDLSLLKSSSGIYQHLVLNDAHNLSHGLIPGKNFNELGDRNGCIESITCFLGQKEFPEALDDLCEHIKSKNLFFHNPDEGHVFLQGLMSTNPEERHLWLMYTLYLARCNLFHGRKGYSRDSLYVLKPFSYILHKYLYEAIVLLQTNKIEDAVYCGVRKEFSLSIPTAKTPTVIKLRYFYISELSSFLR